MRRLAGPLGTLCLGAVLWSVQALAGAPTGPRSGAVKLWRIDGAGTKLFVEADLGDGVPRLFLVDTGASISVLDPETAARAGVVAGPSSGELVGLSGRARYRLAQVQRLGIGPFALDAVNFAVGISGLPRRAGAVPIAGILGNNVWGEFGVAIDYPANRLELYQPGALSLPPTAAPMAFDGQHASTALTVVVDVHGDELRQTVAVDIDTGARGILLNGAVPAAWTDIARSGEELIFGVGAGEDLPAASFLRRTERAPIQAVELGGARVEDVGSATWMAWGGGDSRIGPARMPGLVGHEVLDGHRVVFDFPGQRFALLPAERPPKRRTVAAWALQRTPRWGPHAAPLADRAVWLQTESRPAAARRVVRRAVRRSPESDALVVLAARLDRAAGRIPASRAALGALSAGRLVDLDEVVAAVNGAVLDGDRAGALRLGMAAVAERPAAPAAWVALSDAYRWSGALPEAREAMRTALSIEQNPDGHLLRRAWLSAEEGDVWAARAHLVRLVQLHPHGGPGLYFLATLDAHDPAFVVLQEQLRATQARLHLGEGPLDFFASALRAAGDPSSAAVAAAGAARDCRDPQRAPGLRANCEAWHLALAGVDLDRAERLVERALAATPHDAAVLDTRAAVAEARGDAEGACAAALAAARADPADVYLLWQAWRRASACLPLGATPTLPPLRAAAPSATGSPTASPAAPLPSPVRPE